MSEASESIEVDVANALSAGIAASQVPPPIPGRLYQKDGRWFYKPKDMEELKKRLSLWDNTASSSKVVEDETGHRELITPNQLDVSGITDMSGLFKGMKWFNHD